MWERGHFYLPPPFILQTPTQALPQDPLILRNNLLGEQRGLQYEGDVATIDATGSSAPQFFSSFLLFQTGMPNMTGAMPS